MYFSLSAPRYRIEFREQGTFELIEFEGRATGATRLRVDAVNAHISKVIVRVNSGTPGEPWLDCFYDDNAKSCVVVDIGIPVTALQMANLCSLLTQRAVIRLNLITKPGPFLEDDEGEEVFEYVLDPKGPDVQVTFAAFDLAISE